MIDSTSHLGAAVDTAMRVAANPPGSSQADTGVSNPANPWMQIPLDQTDLDHLVHIVSLYRDQWCTDRLVRQRIWIKNVLFYRNIQILDWWQDINGGNGGWVDTLAWYRGSDKVRDGEGTELEKFQHPITLMLGETFVGVLSREVPATVVRPVDPRQPADVMTALAAQTAIGIIERRNKVRQMVRDEFEMFYLYGTYFKYTRGTFESQWGWDDEMVLGEMQVAQAPSMRCLHCGASTPWDNMGIGQNPSQPKDQNQDQGQQPDFGGGEMPNCPQCQTPMGPESWYEGGAPVASMQVSGTKRVPRAMVRQTIHSPMEIDADPQAKDLSATAILAFDQEADIGELRTMFPDNWDKLHEGEPVSTTAMADYDRLRRNEVYAMGTAYTTDTNQQRSTYSQVWMAPFSFARDGDAEFAARMRKLAPNGLKLSMVGSEVLGVRLGDLTKEWSQARTRHNFGLYSTTVAESVTSFNERFNSAMQAYDDYMMRAPFGLNLVQGGKIDPDKWKGNTLSPTTITPIWLNTAGNESLANVFQHFDIPVNPGLALYPQMLWQFAQLLNGLPPQVAGAGTNEDVETFGGQQLQMDSAASGLTPFWENVKEEHAWAAQNAIECLQKLMKSGACREIWGVVEDEGADFRSELVNLDRMQGQVEVYADEDQDLPVTPQQMRESLGLVFKEIGNGNQAALRLMDVPENQDLMIQTLFPNMVSPTRGQMMKTLRDLQTVAKTPSSVSQNPDGSYGETLAAQPEMEEDMSIAIPTVSEFLIKNADARTKKPDVYKRWEAYFAQCQEMQTQQQVRTAKLQLQVKMAGVPPQAPKTDPGTAQAVQELQSLAMQMAQRLGQLAMLDPAMTGNTASAQVSAANDVVGSAIDAAKEMRLASE